MKIKRDFFVRLVGKILLEDAVKSQIQIASDTTQATFVVPTDLANQFALGDKIKITVEREE